MKALFDQVSAACSESTITIYHPNYQFAIRLLDKPLREPVYGLYSFVQLANELVYRFDRPDKKELFGIFKKQAYQAIAEGISMNPVLNSFQHTVNKFSIDRNLIDKLWQNLEMQLCDTTNRTCIQLDTVSDYAALLGQLFLCIICNGNEAPGTALVNAAAKLSIAFQQINLLAVTAGGNEKFFFARMPLQSLSDADKKNIITDIESSLHQGYQMIDKVPISSRRAIVWLYFYHEMLLKKIKKTSFEKPGDRQIFIKPYQKMFLTIRSMLINRELKMKNFLWLMNGIFFIQSFI